MIRKFNLTLFLFVILYALPLSAQQSTQQGFILGEAVKGEHDSFNIVENVFAVRSPQNNNNQTLQAAGTSSNTDLLVAQKGGFLFYKSDNNQAQALSQSQAQTQTQTTTNTTLPAVVFNNRTGDLGLITGTVIVKLKNFADADNLVRDYNLKETHRFGGILRRVFFKTELAQLNNLILEIKADPRTESVVPEILEHFHVPQ